MSSKKTLNVSFSNTLRDKLALLAGILALIPMTIISGFLILNKIDQEDNDSLTCASEIARNPTLTRIPLYINTSTQQLNFNVELADSVEEQRLGLMCRSTLVDGTGMLFVYPVAEVRSFWMKNTLIPLDILYLDSNKKIITIYENATPLNEEIFYNSHLPSRYVLELPAGTVAKYNISTGDTASF